MKTSHIMTLLLAALIFGATGCRKPVDVPEFVEVGTSETAFMVPLEGSTSDQKKLDSEESYKALQVSTKRLQIPHRWQQTGRYSHEGEWMPTVRVIRVDRSPVTREWTADANAGTSQRDEAIWTESKDSVGFSIGFNCTAYVSEAAAAKFLYWYPSGSLATVMDSEIRNRIQQIASEVAGQYDLDELRSKKQEIIDAIRADVAPFYEARGITVTAIGMFGGFTYENPDIQAAIDAVFVAQQEKAREKALLEAMDSKKQRMLEEGTASANQAREVARGEADAVLLVKEAEAKGITLVNDALRAAQGNPLFVQIKALEVESERIRQWNGTTPQFIMGTDGGGGFVPMIQVPALTAPQ